jgi:hypothetical protein
MSLNRSLFPTGGHKRSGPAACDAFAIFEDLCLLGNVRNSCNSNTSTRRLLSSRSRAYSRTTANSSARRVSPPLHPSETCMPTVVLKSLSCSQHSELLLLLQHYLFPLLLKTLSEHSAFPLALRGTRVVLLLLKQFSFELKTEAEVIPNSSKSLLARLTPASLGLGG